MAKHEETAAPFVPESGSIDEVRDASGVCTGCALYRDATQTVFGHGSPNARVLLAGEQPGDQEDRRGEPFVGPAGRVLDRALDEAGIDRESVYVTNVVKHFKFAQNPPRKRRIHERPSAAEVTACLPWFTAELSLIAPEVVVCLGATAARALLGSSFRVSRERGVRLALPSLAALAARAGNAHLPGKKALEAKVVATIHPSSVLRADDREAMYEGLVADLRVAREVLPAGATAKAAR